MNDLLSKILGLLLMVAIAVSSVQTLRLGAQKRAFKELKQAIDAEHELENAAAFAALERNRIAEKHISTIQQVAANEAATQNSRTRDEYARALAVGRGLRAPAPYPTGGDPGPLDTTSVSIGEAASGRAPMCSDVLEQVVREAVELARIADERGNAGAACQKSYDAVSTP